MIESLSVAMVICCVACGDQKDWPSQAVMSRAGARTWLQPMGHGDMQGFDSSFAAHAVACFVLPAHRRRQVWRMTHCWASVDTGILEASRIQAKLT